MTPCVCACTHTGGGSGECYLAGRFGSLPDAEVADEPGQGQTEGQLPANTAHVLDAI